MEPIDLSTTAATVAHLLHATADDQLTAPTPCPEWTVADLADHIGGVACAFTAAAEKRRLPGAKAGQGDGSRLEVGWRDRIAADLDLLSAGWRSPAAWDGSTHIGGLDLPGDVAGQVALNELLVHGWDLAWATGAPFAPDADAVAAVHRFVTPLAMMDPEGAGQFAAPVPLADDASLLDQVLAHNGRAPRRVAA